MIMCKNGEGPAMRCWLLMAEMDLLPKLKVAAAAEAAVLRDG